MDWSTEPVVVVTGASAGVGRATVRELARRGAKVGLLARGRAGLEAARAEVEAAGGQALAIPVDIADHGAVDAAAERIESELGPIEAWVNAAMVGMFAPIVETSPDEYRRVTEVTYLGTVNGTLAALRRMLPRDSGVIVQVGSVVAYRSIPLQGAYAAAKQAVVGFTDSLRSELLHDRSGVQVAMVHLPAINTPYYDWARSRIPRRPQAMPPVYQPEVPAAAIVDAIERPRREVLVGWPAALGVQAQKLIPGILDRVLAGPGYAGQQTDEPPDGRMDNLYLPVDDEVDRGAHGSFGEHAIPRRPLTTPLTHPGWTAAALAGATAVALLAWRARRD